MTPAEIATARPLVDKIANGVIQDAVDTLLECADVAAVSDRSWSSADVAGMLRYIAASFSVTAEQVFGALRDEESS